MVNLDYGLLVNKAFYAKITHKKKLVQLLSEFISQCVEMYEIPCYVEAT